LVLISLSVVLLQGMVSFHPLERTLDPLLITLTHTPIH